MLKMISLNILRRGWDSSEGVPLGEPAAHTPRFKNLWRRGWDSNPRSHVSGTPVFETGSFNRSDTSPKSCLQIYSILPEKQFCLH
jgi:hypothetical protein